VEGGAKLLSFVCQKGKVRATQNQNWHADNKKIDKIHTGKLSCLRSTTASALASIGSESEYNFACKFTQEN
jgi:hypothetical protein